MTYRCDLVVDRGEIRERKKQPSKAYHAAYGHTPLSAGEKIAWNCRRLVVGTGGQTLTTMAAIASQGSAAVRLARL